MDATIRTGGIPLPLVPSGGRTWARAEDGPLAGRLLRGKTSMRFRGLRLGRGRGTTITWGEHRMADRARALGMDEPAVRHVLRGAAQRRASVSQTSSRAEPSRR